MTTNPTSRPTIVAALAALECLPDIARQTRGNLSMAAAARQAGVPRSTYVALEQGRPAHAATAKLVLRWALDMTGRSHTLPAVAKVQRELQAATDRALAAETAARGYQQRAVRLDAEIAHLQAQLDAARPRVVDTEEARDALPVGVVVRSASGTIAKRTAKWGAWVVGVSIDYRWDKLQLPLTVLWSPDESGSES